MSSEVPEPTFAPPTPPGLLPADELTHPALPAAPAVPGTPARLGPPGTPGPPPGSPREPARTGRSRPRVLAAVVAGLVVVALGVVAGVQVAKDRAWAPVAADVAESRDANAVQLVLGSCLDDLPADGPVGTVRVVPCDSPHGAQVVGRYDSPGDAVWPGRDDLVALASAACGPDLLRPAAEHLAAGLRFVVWTPSEESWADGDRAGLCLASGDLLTQPLI